MTEFTEDRIKRAATAMKMLRLGAHPGMDAVAIKLNSDPTYREMEEAKMWAKAFELSGTMTRALDVAVDMAREFRL